MRVPRLLAIGDRHHHPGENLLPWLRQAANAGVDTIQIREKDLGDLDLLALVFQARQAAPPPCRLLVNGRADIAIGAGVAGVHLPAAGVPPAALRRRFGNDLLIGVSTHQLDEIELALEAGADYVTFGPVYPTPGKERYGPPAGLDKLAAAAVIGIPVVALGGVTIDRFSEVAEAGASGAAGIRFFLATERLGEAVAKAACFDEPRGTHTK
ncbi:MAG: thiamine phosphate synthase [Acidobacteriota bacterium]|nr:thiamine phosphate synthase [Acidobacteriota bacterium]